MQSGEVLPPRIARFGTRRYSKFVSDIQTALTSKDPENVPSLLDGLAGQRCLGLVGAKSVRTLGAFFTPSDIAERIVGSVSIACWEVETTFDPACGAGDLLLPIARRLPVRGTVSATLQRWNNRLRGCDLSPEFVEAARFRLMLLAVSRGAKLDGPPSELAQLLTNLQVADGLSVSRQYEESTCILMNPPYGRVNSGRRPWREGAVTAAALFLDRAVQLSAPGTQTGALLPEVLRTGTSYDRWRRQIATFAEASHPQSIGQFSNDADVDVFIQRFTRRKHVLETGIPTLLDATQETIGSYFSVAVGAVVPHRDAMEGRLVSYLHPKNAPILQEISRISEKRQFNGRTSTPPFVVVRRTSRPGDPHRALASLVLGKRSVAIENHLLVLTPKDGTVETCRALMQVVQRPATDAFLNQTMRCRHLTTLSVASVPWV